MLVDLDWVRMVKKRLALIDATPLEDIDWYCGQNQVKPVITGSNRNESNVELASSSEFFRVETE